MARQAREVQIAALYTRRGPRSGWIRTGETTAVPSLVDAEIHLLDPQVVVQLLIAVTEDGRSRVQEFHLTPSSMRDSVTTTILRKLPIDELVRLSLERATRTDVSPRPDIHPGAYQMSGDPEHQAWVSPTPAPGGRGRAVPGTRVRRAAEIYQQAVASGDHAPTEAVAKAMGYSRPTAARDVRAARELGLLPATPGMVEGAGEEMATSDLPAEASSGKPVWRSIDTPDAWDPIDTWVAKAGERMGASRLKQAVGMAATLGAEDPQAVGEAAVQACDDPAEHDFPLRAGLNPLDLQTTALVVYRRTVGAELAARVQAGVPEDAALAAIALEVNARIDQLKP